MSITMSGSFLDDMPEAAKAQTQNMESTVIMSNEYGMKMEMFMGGKIGQQMYMLPSEKAMITVMPEAKRYMRIELDDERILIGVVGAIVRPIRRGEVGRTRTPCDIGTARTVNCDTPVVFSEAFKAAAAKESAIR